MALQTQQPAPGSPPAAVAVPRARPNKVSALLHRAPRLRLAGLLTAPAGWLVLVYVAALAALLITSLWTVDTFTGKVSTVWTTDNVVAVVTGPVYQRIALRTLWIAVAVTVIDMVIALPMAFFIAKVANPRWQKLLVVAVLMPLWASYLVKAYAWRNVLADGGLLEWLGEPLGLVSPGYSETAVILTLSYIWLPYMILPIYAGFDRVPDSLLEASGDLGAKPLATMRLVMLPLLVPAIIAGTIFTFSPVPRGLHHRPDIRGHHPDARHGGVRQRRRREQPAVCGGRVPGPDRHHHDLSVRRPPHRRPEQPLGAP